MLYVIHPIRFVRRVGQSSERVGLNSHQSSVVISQRYAALSLGYDRAEHYLSR
jgi:hypothetical protein